MSATAKLEKSFDHTDAMSPAMRQCVHEYGYAVVNACLVAGIRTHGQIHQLVREVWEGARQPRQRRPRGGTLDWLLLQAGAQISAAELSRVLKNNNLAIVPLEPTRQMLAASIAEVSGFNVQCTKTEKHRRRLTAALKAGSNYLEHKSGAVSA